MKMYLFILLIQQLVILYCLFKSLTEKKKNIAVIGVLAMTTMAIVSDIGIDFSTVYSYSFLFYTIYTLALTWLLFFVIKFSIEYCEFNFSLKGLQGLFLSLAIADSISTIANCTFLHSFDIEKVLLNYTTYYYIRSPYLGYRIHLFYCYFCFALSIFAFIRKILNTNKFYIQKYVVIAIVFFIEMLWESYYIAFNLPYNISVIGFAFCAILVYFVGIKYLPLLLIYFTQNIIISNMNSGVLFFDNKGDCIYANKNAYELLGIEGTNPELLKSAFWEMVKDKPDQIDITKYTRIKKAGSNILTYEIENHPVLDNNDTYAGSFAMIIDKTSEKKRIEKEKYDNIHDELTGLYNAAYLRSQIAERINSDPEGDYSIVALDIKEFKMVNDIFGWSMGNDVLIKISNIIRNHLTGTDAIYGRIVNDNFGFLVKKSGFDLNRFLESVSNISLQTKHTTYPIIIHIGVYDVTDKSMAVSGMFDRAIMAISTIKSESQVCIAHYSEQLRDDVIYEQELIATLDEALENNEILPFIQAQVNRDGTIHGGEALVRWYRPDEGYIPPYKFIPVLEKNGMLVNLDMHIWEQACILLKKWGEAGRDDTYISINISPIDFYFVNIYDVLVSLVKKYAIDPKRLRLEITETVMMNNQEQTLETIEKLRDFGFIMEMDDFGSGYSSLNMLKDIPVDVLKLDMVFLKDTKNIHKSIRILNSIIDMANQIEVPVIAEGVETVEHVKFLMDAGCQTFQGYYFSKPIHFKEFEEKYINNGLYVEDMN